MKTLDQYDIAFIKHFKSGQPLDINVCLGIWGERCNVAPGTDSLPFIVAHLAELIERYNPVMLREMIHRLDPSRAFWYGQKENTPYLERCLAVFASHLALTEVVKLPGYVTQ